MKAIATTFLLFLLTHGLCAQTNVYSFSLDSIAGNNPINLSNYAGKKILIVNTAAYDSVSWQYQQLSALQNLVKDSLVIIAIPSNSFGKEATDSSFFRTFYSRQPTAKFAVAKKTNITGTGAHPLYVWLTQQVTNGFVNQNVNGNFQKFLIGKNGKLIAVFSRTLSPTSTMVVNAILQAK